MLRRAALFTVLALVALPGAARAAGIDQTCQLTATRFDPDTVNVLYPDSSAQYFSSTYTAVPGTRIRIEGVYPYARYTSWNIYDPVLRPFANLSDFQIQPDAGSANPFIPGAPRNTPTAKRHYTLFITFSPSDHPGPNTIYVDPSQHANGVFTLRVYVPDRGRDLTGGVGLPQVTWESTTPIPLPAAGSPCGSLQKPTTSILTGAYANQSGPAGGAPFPGRTPPDWHKFTNLCQSGGDLLLGNPVGDRYPQNGPNPCGRFGTGGFLSNIDNAYVYSFISRGFGPIVVYRGKAPTFANTYPDAPRMPGGVQLRYWSFCQNDPFSQRYVACARDDQVKKFKGNYTIVIAPRGAWPAAAEQRCAGSATFIPWGPQPQGVVLYRQMLAAASFHQAIKNVDYGSEAKQMGTYYPKGRYFSSWREVAKAYCSATVNRRGRSGTKSRPKRTAPTFTG